jgi:uncharacterized protein
MKSAETKYQVLVDLLRSMEGALVAFSGGVDSTLLLKAAHEALGDRALAVTAVSPLHPAHENEEALRLAALIGARHRMHRSGEMTDPDFLSNPPDRCYICKKQLFLQLKALAAEEGLACVVEGSNVDDGRDHRPGMKAVRELGVRSPLVETGLMKRDIRALLKARRFPNWDKPAQACLASRIPYGESISENRLRRIAGAEQVIASLGIRQLRVRDHGKTARIEVPDQDMDRFLNAGVRDRVVKAFNDLGFLYVSLDLEGYRTGSLNAGISEKSGRDEKE